MSSRIYLWNVFETTLSGALLSGGEVASLTSVSNLRAPGIVTLAPDDAAKREIISFDTINSSNIEGLVRGLGGSAAGAQDHDAGTPVRIAMYHQVVDAIFTDIEDLETHVGSVAIADHPEATPSVRGFISAADKTKLNGYPVDPADIVVDVAVAAVDSGLLDGLDSTQFVRSDVADEVQGVLTFTGEPTLSDVLMRFSNSVFGGDYTISLDDGGDFEIRDHNDVQRLVIFDTGGLNVYNGSGDLRLEINQSSGDIVLYDRDGVAKARWDESDDRWEFASLYLNNSGAHALGHGSGAGRKISVQGTAPSSPAVGDIWIET